MNTQQEQRNNLHLKKRKQHGYSLIETMIAIIIAAIGFISLSTAITDANRLGNSAAQSGVISMTQRSTFSQLRIALSDSVYSPIAYLFRSGQSHNYEDALPLTNALQIQVDQLSMSFNDIRSSVDCSTSEITTCEVCFHWYDSGEIRLSHSGSRIGSGATNRSACQIQIV